MPHIKVKQYRKSPSLDFAVLTDIALKLLPNSRYILYNLPGDDKSDCGRDERAASRHLISCSALAHRAGGADAVSLAAYCHILNGDNGFLL